MRKKLALAALTLTLLAGGGFGASAALAGPGQGHTPVVVCHWVPAAPAGAHQIAGLDGIGGSYVVITVDDDGSTGNNSLEAHLGHDNDLFDDDCPTGEEE